MKLDVLSLQLTWDSLPDALVEFLELDWQRTYVLPITEQYRVLQTSISVPEDMTRVNYPDAEVYSARTPQGVFLKCKNTLLQISLQEKELRFAGEGTGLRLILMLAISELLRLQGFMPLHSSAVYLDGGAVVMLGPSGTGKTTTLLQAARSQVPALSEDWSWIGQDLTLYPWDSGLHLLPDTVERFEDVLPETRTWIPRGTRHKWRFEVGDLQWFQPQSCPLKQFWMLKRHTESALVAVPRLEFVRTLWEASGMPLTREASLLAQQGINRLLKVPARMLHLGFDVNFAELKNES
ncbi:hypothetical protein [Deinococcus cellulosilyticus]|uniref:Uncharacterized protein n=1 Tax=Deinococcus cellulosilyticus (strain DSM 18568 / NBRC 106333 / KACC 11606 / 5516J-15) TaxID=1223518 RepID=A0A511MWU2_DEIC1|nr:hypothetical protein [Deinococcus cellulosilyticus]GEM44748.1 hypothetical protein DC3_03830 [Deinococcus cellulosilyticus NBRC 106333 = KACC 11606]